MSGVGKSCRLGNACRTLVGDLCQEPACDFHQLYPLVPELTHSRGPAWWDNYFMGEAKHVATASRDPSSQCGAVIVRPDKTVASQGFNGFPKGMNDDPALYANRDEKIKRVLHAEENAILFAGERLHGYTIYIQPFLPCAHCALVIIQAGIKRVVAPALATHPERWKDDMARALRYFAECGVECHEHVGPH